MCLDSSSRGSDASDPHSHLPIHTYLKIKQISKHEMRLVLGTKDLVLRVLVWRVGSPGIPGIMPTYHITRRGGTHL